MAATPTATRSTTYLGVSVYHEQKDLVEQMAESPHYDGENRSEIVRTALEEHFYGDGR